MTIRNTMLDLIRTLRGMTNAGKEDYVLAGTLYYWSDEQLQNVLDRYRLDIVREPLSIIPTMVAGGTIQYLNYQSEYINFESTSGGSAIFYLADGDGDILGTATPYTTDYYRGLITFPSNTLGTPYYLSGSSYDLNMSAADVWRQKAAHYGDMFSFSTDNHRIDKGVLINNALKMAQTFEARSGPVVSTLYRSDIDDTAIG
jgi:hypothetical protein